MMPVLPPNTRVWGLTTAKPKTGDVVIFSHEGKEKIKRISEMDQEKIYLLGDHPETSTDSRQFGWLSKADIIAVVFWPRAPKGWGKS